MECVTPHMCTVCWINDHMYCKNMKRTGSDLPNFLPCIHYIACVHFRSMQSGSYLGDCQGSTFRTFSGDAIDHTRMKSFRWNRNELINLDKQQQVQKIVSEDDLLCNEVMLESDAESSNHSTEGTELLQIQLKARTAQIFQSLGVAELPHGSSSPVDVKGVQDPSEDYDGGAVEVEDIAAEVSIGDGVYMNGVDSAGSVLCSAAEDCLLYDPALYQTNVTAPRQNSEHSDVSCNALGLVKTETCDITETCEVDEVELISEEQLDGSACSVSKMEGIRTSHSSNMAKKGSAAMHHKNAKTVKSEMRQKDKSSLGGDELKDTFSSSSQVVKTKKSSKSKGSSANIQCSGNGIAKPLNLVSYQVQQEAQLSQ
jgi:hypothetical protein